MSRSWYEIHRGCATAATACSPDEGARGGRRAYSGLAARNLTADSEIRRIAAAEQRVVVTKDRDFVDSFLMHGEPAKLLFITTGNIPNKQLEQLVHSNWQGLLQMLDQGDYVELSRTSLVLHI